MPRRRLEDVVFTKCLWLILFATLEEVFIKMFGKVLEDVLVNAFSSASIKSDI